jgi:uncharacterized protein (TIGR03437 family)
MIAILGQFLRHYMKYIAALFLCSFLLPAADYTPGQGTYVTGQGARIVIGQQNFTAQLTSAPSAILLGAAGGVAYVNNTLFVVDSNRVQAAPVYNRVLIYNNIHNFVTDPTAEVQQGVRCRICGDTANVVLGQPDFVTSPVALTFPLAPPTASGMRTPTQVASDGVHLVVADTDNNRVLIWNSIPTNNNQPADVVIGQVDFVTVKALVLDNKSFRGPQGVWLQGGRLFVADTQNHRVMVWNSVPTSNGQAADYVLGEPNFSTAPSAQTVAIVPAANNLFYPVSVTSDGTRLFVSDLGNNRVLIWNAIPTQTQQPANLVIGQPDMKSNTPNNSPTLCGSSGVDSTGAALYPVECAATIDTPRFALSDGVRLFVADGGNDRILVYDSLPAINGQRADEILGQVDEFSNNVSDANTTSSNTFRSAANSVRSPLSMATDGLNLYVADAFDRRIVVFTPQHPLIGINGIVNAASLTVNAFANITFGGTIQAGDIATIMVNTTNYAYTVLAADTITTVIQNLADLINGKGGTADPNVVALANTVFQQIVLTARVPGVAGNNITYTVTTAGKNTTTTPLITLTPDGVSLTHANDAQTVAPGSLITIFGSYFTAGPAVAGTPNSQGLYPTTLGGTQLYIDGIKAPLLMVAPGQINAQLPFEIQDATSVSAVVRTIQADGNPTATTAIAIPVLPQGPGIFALPGNEPRQAIAYHASPAGIELVDIGGAIVPGDTATITINSVAYNYTIQSTDTLNTIRDALVKTINTDPNVAVYASPASLYLRIVLTDKTPGADPTPPVITTTTSTTASITVTPLNTADTSGNTTTLGGNSLAGLPVDNTNPAQPNEVIEFIATGLGTIYPTDASNAAITGQLFSYMGYNAPNSTVDDSQVDNFTADVVQSSYIPGTVGAYKVLVQLNAGVATNPFAQAYIAQFGYVSNFVTLSVLNPTTTLALDNGLLTFTYQSKSTTFPAAQLLNVTASAGALAYTVALGNYPDGSTLNPAFVDVDTTAGVTPGTITITMDQTVLPTLAPGTYQALITVTSAAPNSPQYCQIVLTVN